jgi:alkyl hydroperoxide reductase subunit D
MDFTTLADRIPDSAKDLRINLGSLERIETLTPAQLWGSALAAALASRQDDVIRAAAAEVRKRLDAGADGTIAAVRTAAALMAMNNVFYRSKSYIKDDALDQAHGRLRMQGMQSHGAPQADFEMWSIAVSAVNGCGMCLRSHFAKIVEHGTVSRDAVNDVLRISAVVFAVATVLDQERALAG